MDHGLCRILAKAPAAVLVLRHLTRRDIHALRGTNKTLRALVDAVPEGRAGDVVAEFAAYHTAAVCCVCNAKTIVGRTRRCPQCKRRACHRHGWYKKEQDLCELCLHLRGLANCYWCNEWFQVVDMWLSCKVCDVYGCTICVVEHDALLVCHLCGERVCRKHYTPIDVYGLRIRVCVTCTEDGLPAAHRLLTPDLKEVRSDLGKLERTVKTLSLANVSFALHLIDTMCFDLRNVRSAIASGIEEVIE